MTETPAGWYPDPDGQLRYWDGQRWTAEVAPSPAPVAPSAVAPARGVGKQVGRGLLVGGALVIALVVGSVIWSNSDSGSSVSEEEVHDAYCESFGHDDPTC